MVLCFMILFDNESYTEFIVCTNSVILLQIVDCVWLKNRGIWTFKR